MRASLVELMDHASINAVEDFQPMGLDRDAGALLLIQSDAPGAARADEVAVATAACEVAGAKEVFSTDDPEEGEMFVQARRLHFSAIETRGAVLPEDVGVPIPQLPALLAAVEAIAAAARRRDPGRGPRRRRQHPPRDHLHPGRRRRRSGGPGWPSTRSWRPPSSSAARSPASTGSGRLKRGPLEAQLGPDVMALTRRVKYALDPAGILNPGAGF